MELLALAAVVVIFSAAAGLACFVFWLLSRYVHRYAAIGVGGAALLYIVYSLVSGLVYCSAAPTYVPPVPGDGGDGTMLFNCDGPGGAFDHLGLYLQVPIIAFLVWFLIRIARSKPARTLSKGAE